MTVLLAILLYWNVQNIQYSVYRIKQSLNVTILGTKKEPQLLKKTLVPIPIYVMYIIQIALHYYSPSLYLIPPVCPTEATWPAAPPPSPKC